MRQVVAYNIAQARKKRGWTQRELGAELAKVTGTPWSNALVSAAEAGWSGATGRVRSFDVDDVAAFALALDLPIGWFFLPPPTTPQNTVIPDDEPWISCGRSASARTISTRSLRWLLRAELDSDDEHRLIPNRVRGEGEVPEQVTSASVAGLSEFLAQVQVELEKFRTKDT
jgi:transcriptional regulator with XRE-family HTH domain